MLAQELLGHPNPTVEGRKQAPHCYKTQQQPSLASRGGHGEPRGITAISHTQNPPAAPHWPEKWDVPWGSWPQENPALISFRQLQTVTARLISEPALQLHRNLFCSKSFGIIPQSPRAQGLCDLVTGGCTCISQPS